MAGRSVPDASDRRAGLEALAIAYRDTGDRAAFDAYARSFLPSARRFAAARFPREPELRDDAVQEALVRLLDALRRYRGGAPESFAFGVLYRACADLKRRLGRARALERRLGSVVGPDLEGFEAAQDPAHAALDAARATALLDALAGLDERSRSALYLKDAEDLSVAEVAAALNIKEGTAKSILSRARAKARASLEEAGYGG